LSKYGALQKRYLLIFQNTCSYIDFLTICFILVSLQYEEGKNCSWTHTA